MKRRNFIGMLTAAVLAPIDTIKSAMTPTPLMFSSIITTGRANRDGDIIDPKGVEIDEYLLVSQQVHFDRGNSRKSRSQ